MNEKTEPDSPVVCYAIEHGPLGAMLVAATARGVRAVHFGDDAAQLETDLAGTCPGLSLPRVDEPCAGPASASALEARAGECLREGMHALRMCLDGQRPASGVPLDVEATAFQWSVWNYLQAIPLGEVRRYSEIALDLGNKSAARAVGRACALNRVAVLIPCHRAVRDDGGLGGYRWGLERKRALLEREKALAQRSFDFSS